MYLESLTRHESPVCCAEDKSLAIVPVTPQTPEEMLAQDNAAAPACEQKSRHESLSSQAAVVNNSKVPLNGVPVPTGKDITAKLPGASVAAAAKPTHGAHFGIRLALIIDDDETAQMVVAQILEPLGYKVSSSPNPS